MGNSVSYANINNHANNNSYSFEPFSDDCGHISIINIYILMILILAVCYIVDILTRKY